MIDAANRANRMQRLSELRREAQTKHGASMLAMMAVLDPDWAEFWREYMQQVEQAYSEVETRCEVLISQMVKSRKGN